MSMRIPSNPLAQQTTLRTNRQNKQQLDRSLEKLSSGKRINRAADDAAGLALANKLGEALAGLEQGMRNASDGYSMLDVADGGLGQVQENLGRMKELAVTAANGTLSQDQRAAVQSEYDALQGEVDRIAGATEFNGRTLLDGSAGSVDISLGSEGGAVSVDLSAAAGTAALGLAGSRVDGADPSAANDALARIDAALQEVSQQRSDLGGAANRLSSAHRNLAVTAENTYASRSRILDADMAAEAANKARNQVLTQGSTAVLAQGRGLSATALNLLK